MKAWQFSFQILFLLGICSLEILLCAAHVDNSTYVIFTVRTYRRLLGKVLYAVQRVLVFIRKC